MGFPRILSKNNKIYTKLGEFCLAGDHFWIVCHTCQEELQTQAQFWKHIQDEHNFLLNLKHIEARSASFVDADTSLPLPLYRKLNEDEQREEEANMQHSESKDYADMRVMEPSVEIDIKLEPSSISSQPLLAPPAPVANATTAQQQQQQQQPQQIEISAVPTTTQTTLYQLTQTQVTPVSAYATIMHTAQPTAQQLNSSGGITVTAPASALPLLTANATNTHELAPKDSNSTTASASSGAVSSDDGERWYICDYENCGLKFKYQSRLELHRAVHSKERRFACELCGASFKQSCNLSTHRKKKHALKGVKAIPMQNNSQQAQIQQQQHQQQQQQQAQQQQLQQQRF